MILRSISTPLPLREYVHMKCDVSRGCFPTHKCPNLLSMVSSSIYRQINDTNAKSSHNWWVIVITLLTWSVICGENRLHRVPTCIRTIAKCFPTLSRRFSEVLIRYPVILGFGYFTIWVEHYQIQSKWQAFQDNRADMKCHMWRKPPPQSSYTQKDYS